MSPTRSAGERVRSDASADPWWGAEADLDPIATQAARLAGERARRARQQRRRRDGIGWLVLGLLLAPGAFVARRVRSSPRLRRWAIRLAIVAAVLVFLTGSVGVILINNVVIGRTAELGRLDDRRRELRRENALLDSEAAKLQAPPLVRRRAEDELGMVKAPRTPEFIFLDPGSRALNPLQRRQLATKADAPAKTRKGATK